MNQPTPPLTDIPRAASFRLRNLKVLLLASVAAFAVQPMLAASGLNGIWSVDLKKPYGATLRTFMVLHQDGDRLTGLVFPNMADEMPLLGAHMEGAEGVFTIGWGWGFRVRPMGTNLAVLLLNDGPDRQEAVATPITTAELRPPSPLPMSAIRDLPSNGLAPTPPMGWNSWNNFTEAVDDRTVREIADAMVSSGMAAAGYTYVNIDDTWEGGRDAQGNLMANQKFPDMKALARYVHGKGLKLGIYSSPGFVTCGGYPGSLGHEEQDARTFADWGVDYLKYDWCSAGRIYSDSDLRQVYQKMGEALERCGRPIVFSLCEYGRGQVWQWGAAVAGNLWRTTGDIHDNWKSMAEIGFEQSKVAAYAGPGHWNDPDMLEVGNGGMTATEYRTHFSLWCLLAAPLIAGNDLRSMSSETRDILTNSEVIALDQDSLGNEATRVSSKDGIEIWTKVLSDGGQAVGIFNRNEVETNASLLWAQIGRKSRPSSVRDLWKHGDLTASDIGIETVIAPHGLTLLAVR